MLSSKITAELVPHSQFHKGIWLQAIEEPGWYYFMKKQNHNRIINNGFMESVDGPLRELVSFLHHKNIKTTPSCAGHHIGERSLEKIFLALKKESDKIRDKGLDLKDVETGKHYFCHDEDYTLPWNKNHFIKKLSEYQQRGVIGIRLGNRKKAKEQLLKLNVDGSSINEKDSILFIFADESHKGDNRTTWGQITKEVKRILEPTSL